MCLNCGCMWAHDDMGKPGTNITYEDVQRAAERQGSRRPYGAAPRRDGA